MKKRATIVGQGPGRTGENKRPFLGEGSGARLSRLAGVSDIGEVAVLKNVLDKFCGKHGKGDALPADVAASRERKMRFRTKTVIFAGHNTAHAFGICRDYFEPVAFRRKVAFVIPHPSGINRWWNNPKNAAKAKRFMRRVFKKEKTQNRRAA